VGAGLTVAAGAGLGASSAVIDSAAPVPFHGRNQAAILRKPPTQTIVASFDAVAASKAELTELFRAITDRARFLTGGGAPASLGITAPPADSGVLGPVVPGGDLGGILGVGASLPS
jgi:deferrochelatase/peroxidase EfeB